MAALQLAAKQSPASITTGDLAAAVGITQGAVFKHFTSKEAIWMAALDWVLDALMDKLRTVANVHASQGQALNALKTVFWAHIAFVEAHPGVPRLIFQELQHAHGTPLKDRVQQLMMAYRQLVTRLLEQAQQELTVSVQTDVKAAAVLFVGAIQGLVLQSLMAGTFEVMSQQASSVYDIYERGLLADHRLLSRTKV